MPRAFPVPPHDVADSQDHAVHCRHFYCPGAIQITFCTDEVLYIIFLFEFAIAHWWFGVESLHASLFRTGRGQARGLHPIPGSDGSRWVHCVACCCEASRSRSQKEAFGLAIQLPDRLILASSPKPLQFASGSEVSEVRLIPLTSTSGFRLISIAWPAGCRCEH